MIDKSVELTTPAQLENLNAILARMKRNADEGIYVAEDDRQFHQALWTNVDNSMLKTILDIFWMVFYEARKRVALPEPDDLIDTYNRHLAIVNALENRNIAEARKSMKRHYSGILVRMRKIESLSR